jgi:hypothetical protein
MVTSLSVKFQSGSQDEQGGELSRQTLDECFNPRTDLSRMNPNADLISEHVLRGSTCSTRSVAKSAPVHSPTDTPSKARINSSGTKVQ